MVPLVIGDEVIEIGGEKIMTVVEFKIVLGMGMMVRCAWYLRPGVEISHWLNLKHIEKAITIIANPEEPKGELE